MKDGCDIKRYCITFVKGADRYGKREKITNLIRYHRNGNSR